MLSLRRPPLRLMMPCLRLCLALSAGCGAQSSRTIEPGRATDREISPAPTTHMLLKAADAYEAVPLTAVTRLEVLLRRVGPEGSREANEVHRTIEGAKARKLLMAMRLNRPRERGGAHACLATGWINIHWISPGLDDPRARSMEILCERILEDTTSRITYYDAASRLDEAWLRSVAE